MQQKLQVKFVWRGKPIAAEVEFSFGGGDRLQASCVRVNLSDTKRWKLDFEVSDGRLMPTSYAYEVEQYDHRDGYEWQTRTASVYTWEDGVERGIEEIHVGEGKMQIIALKEVPKLETALQAIEVAARKTSASTKIQEMLNNTRQALSQNGKSK